MANGKYQFLQQNKNMSINIFQVTLLLVLQVELQCGVKAATQAGEDLHRWK